MNNINKIKCANLQGFLTESNDLLSELILKMKDIPDERRAFIKNKEFIFNIIDDFIERIHTLRGFSKSLNLHDFLIISDLAEQIANNFKNVNFRKFGDVIFNSLIDTIETLIYFFNNYSEDNVKKTSKILTKRLTTILNTKFDGVEKMTDLAQNEADKLLNKST